MQAPVRPQTYQPRPAAFDGADESFERRLIAHLEPLASHYLASALSHLFATGLYDVLERDGARSIESVIGELSMDADRLRGFLRYLANEDIVSIKRGDVALTARARGFGEFRAWYTLMIGGYSETLAGVGAALRQGAPWCTRDGRSVGLGSCEMSRYDGMPMTKALLARAEAEPRVLLDLGCGNALYLVDFCRQMPGLSAWGAEPNRGGFEEARALVSSSAMSHRISLVNRSASDFLASPPPQCDPDLIVLGYVLHEILAQEGREAVVTLLSAVARRYPAIRIIVIEVANLIDNSSIMNHGLARNFWNPYYLLHYFTNQRLETAEFWESVFEAAALRIDDLVTTPANVDSTGLELGYMLRPRDAG